MNNNKKVSGPLNSITVAILLLSSPLAALAADVKPTTDTSLLAVTPLEKLPARLIVRFDDSAAAVSSATKGKASGSSAIAASQAKAAQMQVDGLSAIAARPMKLLRRLSSGALLVDAGDGVDASALESLTQSIRATAPTGLLSIEPDRLFQASLVPNDPYLPNLWGIAGPTQSFGFAGVNAYTAWDRSTGAGAVVGIIDTGYRPHADLAGQVVAQYDFISDAANANDGDGRDADATDPGDFRVSGSCGSTGTSTSSWHGTHVAGTIAALGNNAVGVTGVAYGAKLVIARVLGRCGGYTSDISDAITWASGGTVTGVPANARPANVLNMSLGGQYPCSASPELQTAITGARSRNVTVVVAAGNSNADASGFSPASCTGVIAVASVGPTGTRAPYSNIGSIVAVAAPGGDMSQGSSAGILSTYNSGSTTPGADSYAYLQGTSMASPHVAGVAALLYAAQPTLTPDQVAAAIKNNVRAFSPACSGCGTGLVDVTKALATLATNTAGSVSFASTGYTVDEAGGSVTISVQRTGGSTGAITVAYATSNGTATAGADYTAASGTLSWANGDTAAKTFSVPIINDTVAEPTETINLSLSNATGGAALGAAKNAVVSINDNDSAPGTISLASAAYTVGEAAGGVTVTVSRVGGSNGAVSATYTTANVSAIAGSDYTTTSGTVSWASGDTADKTFRIPILNDTVVESTETFTAKLTAATGTTLGSPSSATVTITDDDTVAVGAGGTLAFTSTGYTVDEKGGLATITVQRTGGSAGAVKVSYATSNGTATAGADYSASSGSLSWAAGDTASKSFTVPIIDDTIAEAAETINLTLSAPTGNAVLGTASRAVLTINDNDQPGVIALSAATYSIGEAGGSVTITATRTGGAAGSASVSYSTVNGTAIAPGDYTAKTGTLTWPTGDSTPRTFTVPIINDTIKESAETFTVRLASPVTATLGAQASATVTIVDND